MKNFKLTITLVITIILSGFLGCFPTESPENPESTDQTNFCNSGCTNLKKLGCDEGQPLLTPWNCSSSAECPEGSCIQGKCGFTCVQFCKDSITNGLELNAKCWSEINSCSKVNNCGDLRE